MHAASPLLLTTLAFAPDGGGPQNDSCANARPVVAGSPVAFETLGASITLVAPGCAIFGGSLGPDVWFSYSATEDGLLTVSLCGTTDFDSVVAVWEGGDCATLALAPRGCNDDACGLASSMDVTVRAGAEYLIQVGGASGLDVGTGTLQLSFAPGETVPADDCAEAAPLACGGMATFDLAGASLAPGEPALPCSSGPTLGTVWFEFVAEADDALLSTFDGFNLPLDTALAVYEGTCGAPLLVACNDDLSSADLRSRLLLQGLTPGATYLVQVTGHVGGVFGAMLFPGRLFLDCPSPCGSTTTVAARNAGANPAIYSVEEVPVLGGIFDAVVDPRLAGGTSSVLFAFDTPASVTLAGGQVLLAVDGGSGELFTGAGLAPSGGVGVDAYRVGVPNDIALCGLAVHSQAIVLGGPAFALTNAQDLVLGF